MANIKCTLDVIVTKDWPLELQVHDTKEPVCIAKSELLFYLQETSDQCCKWLIMHWVGFSSCIMVRDAMLFMILPLYWISLLFISFII